MKIGDFQNSKLGFHLDNYKHHTYGYRKEQLAQEMFWALIHFIVRSHERTKTRFGISRYYLYAFIACMYLQALNQNPFRVLISDVIEVV